MFVSNHINVKSYISIHLNRENCYFCVVVTFYRKFDQFNEEPNIYLVSLLTF